LSTGTEPVFSRGELVRALGLGELLVAAGLVAMAPMVRGETAYGSISSQAPLTCAGEGYFLLMLAFMGLLVLGRSLAAGRIELGAPGPAVLLALLALYVAVRGAFSDHPYEARRESLAWLSNLLLFALLAASAAGRSRRLMLGALAGMLGLQAGMALVQYYVTLPAMREDLLLGLPVGSIDPQSPSAMSRLLSGEPFTTFLHANSLGAFLAAALVAVSALVPVRLAGGAARAQRGMALVVWLPLAGLPAWALWLTGSKGAWIALIAAVALTLAVVPPGDGRLRRVLRAGGAALLALMLAGALALWLVPPLPGRAGLAASLDVRLGYWKPAAEMTMSNPLFGVGPGKFGAVYPQLKGPLAEEAQSAHSAYMETAAELGLAGLALLLAFWGWSLWRLLAASRSGDAAAPDAGAEAGPDPGAPRKRLLVVLAGGAACTVAATHLVMSQLTVGWLLLMGLVWVCFFLAATWAPRATRGGEGLIDRALLAATLVFLVHSAGCMGMSLRSLVGPALILVALGLSGPAARRLVLTGRTRLAAGAAGLALAVLAAGFLGSREWQRGMDLRRVEIAAAEARAPSPGTVPMEAQLGELKAVEQAIAGDPVNWQLYCGAAQACMGAAARAGDDGDARERLFAQAEKYFRRSAELAPHHTAPRRQLARFLVYWKPRLSAAPAEYERLVALYPGNTRYRMEWADTELLLGRRARALELYRQVLEIGRRTGDEAIHPSIFFENWRQMSWQRSCLPALAGELDSSLAAEGESAPLLLRRALVEIVRGRFAEALTFADRAAATEPDDALLLLLRGYAERLAGDWQKSLETFRAADRLEKEGGRPAGPGAVGRARYRTGLARNLERRRKEAGGGGDGGAAEP
jgi:tetratricopeptide (TPR) repeat protein/O-antigen ligase